MAFSSAVQLWQEWQLRILVLSSAGVQFYLALFASAARKKHIRPLRFSIWLAYLAGHALAIYALATLFDRQRKLRYSSADTRHNLEVIWAPIMLMHLGGQWAISAYNIEDNELWKRHVVTAVSQVAVALYVFCKSWSPLADRKLLAAAIILFILGVFKCFERPLALKRSSFNNLVNSFCPAPRAKSINREIELEEYIQQARNFVVDCNKHPPAMDWWDKRLQRRMELLSIPDKLLVDSAYASTNRLKKLKSLWELDGKSVYAALRKGLSATFNLFYTKATRLPDPKREENVDTDFYSVLVMIFTLTLPMVPIILFHISHKQAYWSSDIIVTFSLLYITYLLEISSFVTHDCFLEDWNDMVAQNSLIGFLARKRNPWLLGIAESQPCYSSEDITGLVQDHVRNGWVNYISDIESYWKFSDTRGNWTLERNRCEKNLGASIEKPFDESIILWHVATDFCFHHKGSSPYSKRARLCREISNYMVHLLFDNPEMLIPGSRRTLFTDACNELEALLKDEDLSLSDEKKLAKKIIGKMGTSEEGNIVHDSWVLAQKLMRLGEVKMWGVIEGVWIEMLCFSASRCRGYLHAKNLASGGEYLTFVSLLMSHAGLETFAERQQRVQLRLPKKKRVKIAKQRIQEVAGKKRMLPREKRVRISKEREEAARNQAASTSGHVSVTVSRH